MKNGFRVVRATVGWKLFRREVYPRVEAKMHNFLCLNGTRGGRGGNTAEFMDEKLASNGNEKKQKI
jgi:hypothetical protein